MKSRSSTRTNGNGVLSAAASHRPGNGNGTSSSSFSAPSELGKEALSRKSFAWVDRVSNPDTQIKALEVRQAYRMFYPVHQPSLYGFPLPKGQPQPCKKNCKFNPRCYCGEHIYLFYFHIIWPIMIRFNGSTHRRPLALNYILALGEGLWTDTSPASSDIDDEDLLEADNDERRPNFLPAGLRNLGNTCYVNSFLQVRGSFVSSPPPIPYSNGWPSVFSSHKSSDNFLLSPFLPQIWFHNPSFRQAMYGWDPRHDPKEAENRTLNDPSRYKPLGTAANLQALFALMEFTNRR